MSDEKQKRRPGYPITINKNVESVREKVQNLCKEYDISASLLFEAIIDGMKEDDWAKFAVIARKSKAEKSRAIKRARLIRTGRLKLES